MSPYKVQHYGSKNEEVLDKFLSENLMFGVKKKDILKDLPTSTVTILPVDIGKCVDFEVEDLERAVEEEEPTESMVEEMCRTTIEKLPLTSHKVESYLRNNESVILYAYYHKSLDAIESRFKKFNPLRLDGKTKDKKELQNKFNSAPGQLLVAQLKTVIGLNLHSHCHIVMFYEPWFSESAFVQAMDRIHREGQTHPCETFVFQARDSMDDAVMGILRRKKQMKEKFSV